MEQKVLVTGQGHRFPAGQANRLNVKSEPDGIAELRFDLTSRESIKQGIAKINQHMQKIQDSLAQAKQFQNAIHDQMQKLRSLTPSVSSEEVSQILAQFNAVSKQFTTTYQALNSQANVRRHTVVALLS